MANFCGEVEEIPANVCGQIIDRYIIEAPVDDMVKRDFSMYQIYDVNSPELVSHFYWICYHPENGICIFRATVLKIRFSRWNLSAEISDVRITSRKPG